jgi:hypothetical protein
LEFKTALKQRAKWRKKNGVAAEHGRPLRPENLYGCCSDHFFFFLNFFAAGGLHIFFGSTPCEIFLSPYTSGAPSAGLLLRRLQNILKNTNHFSGSLGSWVDEERS